MDFTDTTFSFKIANSESSIPLGIRIQFDKNIIYENAHITDSVIISHVLNNTVDGDHTLDIEMFGKLPEHTKINQIGEITQDASLTITDMLLDDIVINPIVNSLAEYRHDFNGSQPPTVAKFYSEMGCNGTVSLKFTTPVYLWLLENM